MPFTEISLICSPQGARVEPGHVAVRHDGRVCGGRRDAPDMELLPVRPQQEEEADGHQVGRFRGHCAAQGLPHPLTSFSLTQTS